MGHDRQVTTVPGHALASRLGAATRSCRDVEALAAAVCASVAAAVPYAFGCLATTDPATGLISWAYKTHPLEIGDEEFAAAEYGAADINQFAEIARRPEPVAVLSIDTGGRASSCRRFREFLAPRFGFTDELRVAFRAQGLTWAVLALYRGEGQAPFSAQDARALAAVHELVARIVRRVLFAPRAPEVLPAHGPAVLIVDADDRVREMTAAARHRIHELGGWENAAHQHACAGSPGPDGSRSGLDPGAHSIGSVADAAGNDAGRSGCSP